MRVVTNIEQIKELPGATVMRSGDDRISLEEARAELEDILRFQVQPLVLRTLREPGFSEDPRELDSYISGSIRVSQRYFGAFRCFSWVI